MNWIWSVAKRIYQALGRTIGQAALPDLRDEFTAAAMAESDALMTGLVVDGDITLQQWVLDMRALIRDTYRAQYELAIGGRNVMTFSDYGRLGGILRNQYRYLQGFAEDLAAGKLSPLQAMARARMYIDSSTQAFERAQAAALGITLPQYPGDGNTVCLANCKCNWRIVVRRDEYVCYWELGVAEHCVDCLRNSKIWSPLRIPRYAGEQVRVFT